MWHRSLGILNKKSYNLGILNKNSLIIREKNDWLFIITLKKKKEKEKREKLDFKAI